MCNMQSGQGFTRMPFWNKSSQSIPKPTTTKSDFTDFSYLDASQLYFDAACQSLRPQAVIQSQLDYYQQYNACGGRVKYEWGQKVDSQVAATRQAVLNYLKLPVKEYVAAFTINTTYGINTLLNQVRPQNYTRIVTSEIEHNSVFLPTMVWAKRVGCERLVLPRLADGSLNYQPDQLEKAIVVVNAVSNIDGRALQNMKQLVADVHRVGGIVIIDAAQAMAHQSTLLHGVLADAICFSSHKMYGPSLGVMVVKKSLINQLELSTIGGGMVSSVGQNSYTLTPDDLESRLEAGLQPWAEIIGLGAALKWIKARDDVHGYAYDYLLQLAEPIFNSLNDKSKVHVLNSEPSAVISFYSEKIDAHRLAAFLSQSNIMARSGYFCAHYYLQEVMKQPPLLRLSLGLHNKPDQVDQLLQQLDRYL